MRKEPPPEVQCLCEHCAPLQQPRSAAQVHQTRCGSSARFQFSYIEIVGRHPHQYFNICVSSVHHFNRRRTKLKLQHSRQNNGWCGSLQVQRESESTAKRFLELILKTNSRWRSCLIFVFSDNGKNHSNQGEHRIVSLSITPCRTISPHEGNHLFLQSRMKV